MILAYPIAFSPTGIPNELKQHPSWCVWRAFDGRKIPRKVDDTGNAKLSDPATLASFDEALAAYERPLFQSFAGLAIFLSRADDYFCVDLDSCLAEGRMTSWASEIVQSLPSYVDISPSGSHNRRSELPGCARYRRPLVVLAVDAWHHDCIHKNPTEHIA